MRRSNEAVPKIAIRIMPTLSRTIRLFVRSTFSDMKAERDLPQLCLANGMRFQPIDLRWDVPEEAAQDKPHRQYRKNSNAPNSGHDGKDPCFPRTTENCTVCDHWYSSVPGPTFAETATEDLHRVAGCPPLVVGMSHASVCVNRSGFRSKLGFRASARSLSTNGAVFRATPSGVAVRGLEVDGCVEAERGGTGSSRAAVLPRTIPVTRATWRSDRRHRDEDRLPHLAPSRTRRKEHGSSSEVDLRRGDPRRRRRRLS